MDETADGGAKRTACVAKARTKCAAALGAIAAARDAFVAGVTASCAGLDAAEVTGDAGLGYGDVDCSAFGGAATDLAGATRCLAKQHDCLTSQIFQFHVPRVLDLLQFTPPDAAPVAPADADTLACLEDVGGTGADLNDLALGKAVAKCQKAVAKIGAKLASQRLAGRAKCTNALFVCAATKTGSDLATCNAKAQAGCAKAFAKDDAQSDALEAATGKACGDPAVFPAFLSAPGGNLEALLPSDLVAAPRAVSFGCSPLVTVADYQRCLVLHILGLSDDLLRLEVPRADGLLEAIGCSLGECTVKPPPTDRFVDNGDGTVTDNQTGLQWEKKTGTLGRVVDCRVTSCPDPHDVNNAYQWCANNLQNGACDNAGSPADGGTFTNFLAKLNTPPCFAGHCDWRLPSEEGQNTPFTGVKELQSILLQPFPCPSPCIDPIFGPTYGGPGSAYWSATTDTATDPSHVWAVYFGNGFVAFANKFGPARVRAVRDAS